LSKEFKNEERIPEELRAKDLMARDACKKHPFTKA
jgi:hypothetical protein